MLRYSQTLVPDGPWKSLSPTFRKNFIAGVFVPTWGALVLGYGDVWFWKVAIAITFVHALILLPLVRFRPLVFPVQLRLVYTVWLALGTFVPELVSMMYITTVGLAAQLAFGYCPLARMLYLLPWNRARPMSLNLFVRTFLQPPTPGRFEVTLRQSTVGSVGPVAA